MAFSSELPPYCCFYSEEMQMKIESAFDKSSLLEHFMTFATRSTKTEDYSVVYNAMENFRRQLEALGLPMVGILKWMNLIYSLIAPLGFPNYNRSGNSNGKIIIRLLLELSIINSHMSIIPESFECQSNLLFRIHVFTHLSKQPSEARLKSGASRTQDAIMCKAIHNIPLGHQLFTEEFHNVPCIFIGDIDTGTDQSDREAKESFLKRDMQLYKRGFDAVQPMGLLLNDLKVQCFISNDLAGDAIREFFLGKFGNIMGLLKLLNERLHNCASPSAELIYSIMKEKAVDKKRKVAALIKNTVPQVKFPKLDDESDNEDGEVDNEEENEN